MKMFFFCIHPVCRQLARGVAAVFGPASTESSTTVGSVCYSMDVPFVETRWDYQERVSMVTSINLHPNNRHISRAIRDLVYYYRWTAITIIYQEDIGESLFKVPSILTKLMSVWGRYSYTQPRVCGCTTLNKVPTVTNAQCYIFKNTHTNCLSNSASWNKLKNILWHLNFLFLFNFYMISRLLFELCPSQEKTPLIE